MKTVRCPECQRELKLPETAKSGDVIDCPFWASVSLRLREEGFRLIATVVKKASCPNCERVIILPDDANPGDTVRCCGRNYRLTYEFGSWALGWMRGKSLVKNGWLMRKWRLDTWDFKKTILDGAFDIKYGQAEPSALAGLRGK